MYMNLFGKQRLTGLMLAVAVTGAALAPVAFAQEAAPAQATAPAATPEATAPAVEAAPAPAEAAAPAEEEAAPPSPDKGDTTWMLTSTVLVLLMILPGLALFYGGLVRQKNMLSMLMQVSIVTVIGMMAWAFWGYSLAFTDGGGLNKFIGGTSKLFLSGAVFNAEGAFTNVETFSNGVVIPEVVFVCFQMTFACITAALVLGGVAERMKFAAVVAFAVLWPLLSYYPMAHMVWWWAGATSAFGQTADALAAGAGQIWAFGALDFAGGTVVHINSGIAALVGAIVLGKRVGFGRDAMAPHNLPFTMIGASLLWVGWFGFNAGSALEANGSAALAFLNTILATAAGGLAWMFGEWMLRGRPSMLGLASGVVAGLVAITPAAGIAGTMGGIVLGAVAGLVCLWAVVGLKRVLGYDDSLDVFGIHGVGGIIGAIGTGIVASPALGGIGFPNETLAAQVLVQAKGVLITIVWSGVVAFIAYKVADLLVGLRVTEEEERQGLDTASHGERAYSA
jgi:Amt family ammonium transporter